MSSCVCGSGEPATACCDPIIAGAPALTAVALMRSRYAAYARGAIDHVMATHDPETRGRVDREAAARWSRETHWLGLEVVATERGGERDDEGMVEFIARGITGGSAFAQRELSQFRRVDGRWYYRNGRAIREPALRPSPQVPVAGRNDPCPCGSGVKYKRCHGA